MSRNLPFWLALPGGEKYTYLLETDLLLFNVRSHNLYHLGVADINIVGINRSFASVFSMTVDDLNTLKI